MILDRIKDAVKKGVDNPVGPYRKTTFIANLGTAYLDERSFASLAKCNANRPQYAIERLFVMQQDGKELVEVKLLDK